MAERFKYFAEQGWAFAALCLSLACIAYFRSLDHFLFSSRAFSPIFRRLLTTYDEQAAWVALAVCVLAAFWSRVEPVLRLVASLGRHPRCVSIAVVASTSVGALLVYHHYPLSMDEYAALFQSKIFASGHIFATLPRHLIDWLVVRGFNGEFLVASSATGRVVEQYWPGFSLLLTPFQFFGVPWLCNACLSGIAIYLIHRITFEITGDRRSAGWAALFALGSSAFIADGLSYYSMQAHLVANLAFAALLTQPSNSRALAAGLVGSVALILHNPVPHALFALPWIVWLAVAPAQRRYVPWLLAGYLPGVLLGAAWLTLRSSIGAGPHGLSAALAAADGVFAWPGMAAINMRTAAIVKMWLWAVPCVYLFAVLGAINHRDNPVVSLLAQSAALTFVAYFFVRFDQGHGWGYRYFHSAWGFVPICAGCYLGGRSGPGNERLVTFAGAAAILNFLILLPFQLHQIDAFISAHLAQLPQPKEPGNNVYFIHPGGGFYVADMVQMDPLLRDRDLVLVSRGTELDEELIRGNWPNAVKLSGNAAADHWYLGGDYRIPLPGKPGEKRFEWVR